jgi:hypothetical protein
MGPLMPGASMTISPWPSAPSTSRILEIGKYHLICTVDPADKVMESDEKEEP